MNPISKWFGNYIYEKALKKSRPVSHLSLSSVKKVAVLLSFGPQAEEHSRNIRKLFKKENPQLQVDIFSYKRKISQKEGPFTNFNIISQKEVNWYQRPVNMRGVSVDWLIDLTDKPDLPLMFMGAMSNAPMKSGIEQPYNQSYLQLMIQRGEKYNPVYSLEQLIHYIKLIKTDKHAA